MSMAWNEALEKDFQQTRSLVRLCFSEMTSLFDSDVAYSYKGHMLFFLAKAFKTYEAIHLLSAAGYFQDAAVLTRTVFEITLQSSWMALDPIKRGDLFAKHDPVDRYYLYQKLSKYPDLVEGIEKRQEELARLQAVFDELSEAFQKGKGWWGNDLRWLARELGMEKAYLRVYPLYSPLVHSTSTSVKYYLTQDDQGIHIDISASDAGQKLAAFEVATGLLLIIAGQAAAAWGLSDLALRLSEAATTHAQPP